MNEGWLCPRCNKINAPSVKECGCKPIDLYSTKTYRINETLDIPPVYPMPICGCTRPCANANCPHRPVITC